MGKNSARINDNVAVTNVTADISDYYYDRMMLVLKKIRIFYVRIFSSPAMEYSLNQFQ